MHKLGKVGAVLSHINWIRQQYGRSEPTGRAATGYAQLTRNWEHEAPGRDIHEEK